jgi:hypothetical protein
MVAISTWQCNELADKEYLMTPLPSLANWEETFHSLHKAAMLLGAIRQLVRPREANYLELALRVEPNGLSTDTLPSGGNVLLDFTPAALVYTGPAGNRGDPIPLADHSQASLFEALLREMAVHDEVPGTLWVRPQPGQSYIAAMLAALDSSEHVFKPKSGELTSDAPLAADLQTSGDYSRALYRIFTATARFRARLTGPQTPIVVWPEHFDLSTLWFPTNDRSDVAPLMNFGLAPFDAASERPYLYAYAYPMPVGFEKLPLPAPASWHTEGWKGLFVAYDDLARADDPEALIESLFERVYELLAPTLR